MKAVLVLFLAFAVVHIVCARRHKSHKAQEDRETTTEPGVNDSGSTSSYPSSIGNFQVPSAFVNDVQIEDDQQYSGRRHHSRKSHKH